MSDGDGRKAPQQKISRNGCRTGCLSKRKRCSHTVAQQRQAAGRHIDDETIRQEATGDCIEWDMLSATVHVGGGGLRGRSTTRLHDRQE